MYPNNHLISRGLDVHGGGQNWLVLRPVAGSGIRGVEHRVLLLQC
jgi:hypothetical protein